MDCPDRCDWDPFHRKRSASPLTEETGVFNRTGIDGTPSTCDAMNEELYRYISHFRRVRKSIAVVEIVQSLDVTIDISHEQDIRSEVIMISSHRERLDDRTSDANHYERWERSYQRPQWIIDDKVNTAVQRAGRCQRYRKENEQRNGRAIRNAHRQVRQRLSRRSARAVYDLTN